MMFDRSRRAFLRSSAALLAGLVALPRAVATELTGLVGLGGRIVNDIHSRLNPTLVAEELRVHDRASVVDAIRRAASQDLAVSIAGGRHAMGGQQFGQGTLLLDSRGLDGIRELDAEAGTVTVDAGVQWPELVAWTAAQAGGRWGIRQKQTGADRLCIGGAVSANVHGRGLTMAPIVADVESLRLVDASGELRECSRDEEPELFGLAVGGYGLLGAITDVTLRLSPRVKLVRDVSIIDIADLPGAFEQRIADGYLYGDCQFTIDPAQDDFMARGVYSCYRPVEPATPIPAGQRSLADSDWRDLLMLAHADPTRAFELYSGYYLSTTGQVYWSDDHQLSTYEDGYHGLLDRNLGSRTPATEMITEVYVRRPDLPELLSKLAADFRTHGVKLIYGTIRLIRQDAETFLTWASDDWACVVMNLHVEHSPEGVAKAAEDFRRVIDRAIELGGSYFLTYHRWARRDQVLACYPQMPAFLQSKRRYDPQERFQSDWYRHYRALLS